MVATSRLEMVIGMDDLRGLGRDLEAADSKSVFAFGVVVGAFVPLLCWHEGDGHTLGSAGLTAPERVAGSSQEMPRRGKSLQRSGVR
jgi:hypothetical protein